MDKSAFLWFEFLYKRFGPGPSSVESQVRWKQWKDCIRHEKKKKKSTQKNFVVCAYALVGGFENGMLVEEIR